MPFKKSILVTGASRGIGKAIALKFAEKNFHVFINANKSQKELLDVADEIRALGGSCHPILADVSDYQAVKNMFEEINLITPCLDVVVNNAGISHVGLFTQTTPEDWLHIIGTNLNSIYNICHHAVPAMIQKQTGCIINISSIWGISGASMEVAYSASKGGIHALTSALAKELGPSRIRVNAIACGAIDTEMNNWLTSEDKSAFEEEIALCRFGKVTEVADLAYFLASDSATYLTGEIIKLDGGTL